MTPLLIVASPASVCMGIPTLLRRDLHHLSTTVYEWGKRIAVVWEYSTGHAFIIRQRLGRLHEPEVPEMEI